MAYNLNVESVKLISIFLYRLFLKMIQRNGQPAKFRYSLGGALHAIVTRNISRVRVFFYNRTVKNMICCKRYRSAAVD